MRLDRFLSRHTRQYSNKEIRLLLEQGKVSVDDTVVFDGSTSVDDFSAVKMAGESLQQRQPAYLMLHKPQGCVSATKDAKHPTVLDLINHPQKAELHIAGRLDYNTTGLLLLTNHGSWSKRLMLKESRLPKIYFVTTEEVIPATAVEQFRQGFYFETEGITTLPAPLEIVSPHTARLTLVEGRYHQVKRMFGRLGIRVIALHRESVGTIMLDNSLAAGEWRALTPDEIFSPRNNH